MKNFKDIANQFNSIEKVQVKGNLIFVSGLNLSDEPFQLDVQYQFKAVAKAVQAKLQNLIR